MVRFAILLSPLRREENSDIKYLQVSTKATWSGARSLRFNSVVFAVALRVGGDEIEEGDAEAAARIQRTTERCIHEGPRTQGKRPWLGPLYFPRHSGVREAGIKAK